MRSAISTASSTRSTGPLDQRVLEIAPVEKPWGPDFFRFDAGLASYEGGDLFAILRL